MADERVSESAFRVAVPRYVGGTEVVEVVNYRPARADNPKPSFYGPGNYAAAIAICRWGENEWSSHVIVFADDRPRDDPDRWFLSAGTYHSTRAAVARQARIRTP